MNTSIELLQLIKDCFKDNSLFSGLLVTIGVVDILIKNKDKYMALFPSNEKDLNRLNDLIKDVDYKQGKKIKALIKESKKKLHFKMATGLIFNSKNKALFNYYNKHKELGEWSQYKSIASFVKLEKDRLIVKYGFYTKIVFPLLFFYWGTMCLFSLILYFVALSEIDKSIYIWGVLLLIIIVFLTSSFMLAKQLWDLMFLKLIKDKIK